MIAAASVTPIRRQRALAPGRVVRVDLGRAAAAGAWRLPVVRIGGSGSTARPLAGRPATRGTYHDPEQRRAGPTPSPSRG